MTLPALRALLFPLVAAVALAAAGLAGTGPGPGLHPGHRRRPAGSGSRGLAQLAAHARRVGLQPARPRIDTGNVSGLRLAWSWGLEPGVSQTTPLVHDGVMYLVNPGQRRAGARRADRQLHLGAPPRDGRAAAARGADAQPRHLRGPDHPQHGRRAHRGPRCPHRRGALGYGRRARRRRLRLLERAGRGRRHDRGGAAGLRALPRGHLLHRRRRRPHRAPAVAHVHHRPPGRARAATPGATCRCCSAPAATPGFPAATTRSTGSSTTATAQAKPWTRDARGTDGDALYSNSTLALDPATGEMRWYLPAHPGRQPRQWTRRSSAS